MSVTVEDILRLPCLREACVLAGSGGLQRTVSSITVLEYSAANALQERIFNNIIFYGSEIVISAFANAAEDVDVQCANIRMLAEAGEVGLILYYVGIIMPFVDERLVELADSLDFVLISMPEKRYDLRYGEVISEVMEAIVKDQLTDSRFQNEILDRVSRLPGYQRSIDTVMRMLSDRLHCSLVLTDEKEQVLNAVAWPRTLEAEIERLFAGRKPETELDRGDREEKSTLWQRCELQSSRGIPLRLFFWRERARLTEEEMRQAREVVQIAINLWSQGHGQEILPELVRAILQDEPVRMRRIAAAFHIDVASIHNMWVLQFRLPEQCGGAVGVRKREERKRREECSRNVLNRLREALSHICGTVVADIYEDCIVAFMDDAQTKEGLGAAAMELEAYLHGEDIGHSLAAFQQLRNTGDVRKAYLLARDTIDIARTIFPVHSMFSLQKLQFAQSCRQILAQGEEEVQERFRVLEGLMQEDRLQYAELCDTAAVYMLDAEYSPGRTAELLYLHKNTIKYRIARISERLGYPVERMPENILLYEVLALRRVLLAESAEQRER